MVTVDGGRFSGFSISSGVPQGSVLGPLLFLLYINDIPGCVEQAECRLYADDTLLCMNLDNSNLSVLQSNIDSLSSWSKLWGMKFNTSKCVHMKISHKGGLPTDNEKLTLNDTEIPRSSSLKYLGITIENTLKWTEHITNICRKANRSLGMLRRCLNGANSKTSMFVYNAIVRPCLEYSSQVWSPHNVNLSEQLEKIQRRAIRWAYRLHRVECVSDTMEINNIISLSRRREQLDERFLNKVQLGDYNVKLSTYLQFNSAYNTRGKTVNPFFSINQFKYSYFNRMRPFVKILF